MDDDDRYRRQPVFVSTRMLGVILGQLGEKCLLNSVSLFHPGTESGVCFQFGVDTFIIRYTFQINKEVDLNSTLPTSKAARILLTSAGQKSTPLEQMF